jgi:hypothetical protein
MIIDFIWVCAPTLVLRKHVFGLCRLPLFQIDAEQLPSLAAGDLSQSNPAIPFLVPDFVNKNNRIVSICSGSQQH